MADASTHGPDEGDLEPTDPVGEEEMAGMEGLDATADEIPEGVEEDEAGGAVGTEARAGEESGQLEALDEPPSPKAVFEGLGHDTERHTDTENHVDSEHEQLKGTGHDHGHADHPARETEHFEEKKAKIVVADAPNKFADRIEIKFVILPEGFHHVVYFPPGIPGVYLYNQLSRDLRVQRTHMSISWNGKVLRDVDVLNQVVKFEFGVSTVLLNVEFQTDLPPHLKLLTKGEHCLCALGVHVKFGADIPTKDISVVVVKDFDRKQFLGGYRHKLNATEYLHAFAQTEAQKKAPKPRPPCYSRVTQTAGVTRSQQTKREAHSQMARHDLLLDESHVLWIAPRKYFSASELMELRIAKCVKLQAYIRGFFARRLARRLREDEERKKAVIVSEQERLKGEYEARKQREIQRRTNPRTHADFSLLYDEVEAWKLQETNQIKESNLSPQEQQVALQELLRKQLRLFETIEKLQQKANVENRKTRIENTLNEMSSTKKWQSKKSSETMTVETPFTVRAKELADLYNGLQLQNVTVDERLDILLHVKWTVKEFECPLTREIVELVDREADLLNRSRPKKSLLALRKRLSNLFLQFIETPEFNPESINHQRVPLEFTQRPLVKLDAKK